MSVMLWISGIFKLVWIIFNVSVWKIVFIEWRFVLVFFGMLMDVEGNVVFIVDVWWWWVEVVRMLGVFCFLVL